MDLNVFFEKIKTDPKHIGLICRQDTAGYFCTPPDARIFGWAGADGIHYCTLDSQGERIFEINPSAAKGEYIRLLAENFTDFLRLILEFGDAGDISHFSGYTQELYDTHRESIRKHRLISPEQQALLNEIAAFGLTPMVKPVQYLRDLQASFDSSTLTCPPEYDADIRLPEEQGKWEVSFANHSRNAPNKPGTEIRIGKGFKWGEHHFFLPAVYLCGEGLVIDLCSPTDPEKMTAFLKKYAWLENHPGRRGPEVEELLRMEHPTNREFECTAVLNGQSLRRRSARCRCWYPDREDDRYAGDWVAYYGLDPDMAWTCIRVNLAFEKWPEGMIESLEITLSQHPVEKTVGHFDSLPPGSEVEAVDPFTGIAHTITILGEEDAELPEEHRSNDEFDFPPYYRQMEYHIEPEPEDNVFPIRDTEESDDSRPRPGFKNPDGVIGTAGAIGIMIRRNQPEPGEKRVYTAVSSMHFEQRDSVRWRIVFKGKTVPDLTVKLL